MNEPGAAIRADVRLHAKVPFIALPGLVHLGIALAVLILGRAGCMNDRGIDDRAATDRDTAVGQIAMRCRNLQIVVSSGTPDSPRSARANARIEIMS